jgi:hypothetical protein
MGVKNQRFDLLLPFASPGCSAPSRMAVDFFVSRISRFQNRGTRRGGKMNMEFFDEWARP